MVTINTIDYFLKLKTLESNTVLPDHILQSFNILFKSKNTTNNTTNISKSSNILKSYNIQQKKDTINNKVNLILNKLSENTVNGLILEFINNIGKITIEQYNDVQKCFYIKIINEDKFIDIYIYFIKILDHIYFNVQNFTLEYFFNIIECKFKYDYKIDDMNLIDKYEFLINYENNEKIRSNNLLLIKKLHINELISDELIKYCNNIYIIDIYHWFNNKKLNNNEIIKIKNIIKNKNIILRDKTLLEKLLNTI